MEKRSLNIFFNLSFCATQKNLIWNTDLVRNMGDNIFITGMICYLTIVQISLSLKSRFSLSRAAKAHTSLQNFLCRTYRSQ